MTLSSPAFKPSESIPSKYSLDGSNLSPPLIISNVPTSAQSLALIMNDPDAPAGDWAHWLLWNIDPKTSSLEEGDIPPYAIQGLNDFGRHQYDGPHPPSGIHRYLFTLYALDIKLDLTSYTQKPALLTAIKSHLLEVAHLMGQYQRS
jgi:Raf kinase inhibitor-like YbhB/YbcL family protein